MGFLRAHGWEIGRLTFEHLWLTLSAMLLAVAVGLPLGVLLTRKQGWAKPVIGFANVVQTVPSLALFGLLLPVPWLGENAARLAILALTGYALLPILRNTYAGIGSVDPALMDVANALGMTRVQRLFKVELAAGGECDSGWAADGYGDLCGGGYDCGGDWGGGSGGADLSGGGVSVDNGLVLAGAIPAALLALAADAGSGVCWRRGWRCGGEDALWNLESVDKSGL